MDKAVFQTKYALLNLFKSSCSTETDAAVIWSKCTRFGLETQNTSLLLLFFANPIYYGVSNERSCAILIIFLPKTFSTTPLVENMNVKYENIYYSTTRRNFMLLMFIYIYHKPILVMQTNHHHTCPPPYTPFFYKLPGGQSKQNTLQVITHSKDSLTYSFISKNLF